VTIAVDSYSPVTDARSVYELSQIERSGAAAQIQREYGFPVNFERAKHFLEENDGGEHVQGDGQAGAHRHGGRRRDDIFSIIVAHGGLDNIDKLSLLHRRSCSG
jgi:K(+)-stimulated pyrophosphate-energized sodium pump